MADAAGPLQALEYTALERVRVPRPVDRLDFIQAHAAGRRVLDLGALDETAFDAKQDNAQWLHGRLCASAASVLGVDNSARIPPGGLDTIGGGRIIQADIFDLAPVVAGFGKPDLVVAGELIEHLPDTLGFLRSLKANASLRGAELLVSTPNACAWHNLVVGLVGRESMHRDHLQIYSYKTLRTLFERAGIELVALQPYHARFPEMIEASQGLRRLAVRGFQGTINVLETVAPVLSGGWIAIARL